VYEVYELWLWNCAFAAVVWSSGFGTVVLAQWFWRSGSKVKRAPRSPGPRVGDVDTRSEILAAEIVLAGVRKVT